MREETEFFYSLTPEKILSAVEQTGLRCTGRVLQLNSMENRVYEVEIELPRGVEEKSRYDAFRVVKFYRPGRWSREQIQAEHQFLIDLVEMEIPVIAPGLLPEGNTLGTVDGTEIFFAVFPKAGGRNLDELSDEQLEVIGRFIARMHNVGAAKAAPTRRLMNVDTFGVENLQYLLSSTFLPQEFADPLQRIVDQICTTSRPWFDSVAAQRIHGDCHLGNVLWSGESCFLVDFDDMVRGPWVQDVWLIVPGRDEDALRRRACLMRGYRQMRDIDELSLRLIEPLRALRMVHFCAWIGQRWEDAAFQRVFPRFGTGEYWREHLIALDECFRLMCTGSLD